MQLFDVQKSGDGRWLFAKDPLSEIEVKTQYSTPSSKSPGTFSDSTYREFIKDNNHLVSLATSSGEKIPVPSYEKFCEVGLRVSQQLNGPLRERTFDQYEDIKQQLEEEIIQGRRIQAKRQRDQDLESLITPEQLAELPEDDREKMSELVQAITAQDIPIREGFLNKTPRAKISHMQEYTDPVNKYVSALPPEARLPFVELTKGTQRTGEQGYHNGELDFQALIATAEGLSPALSREYFNILNYFENEDDDPFSDVACFTRELSTFNSDQKTIAVCLASTLQKESELLNKGLITPFSIASRFETLDSFKEKYGPPEQADSSLISDYF